MLDLSSSVYIVAKSGDAGWRSFISGRLDATTASESWTVGPQAPRNIADEATKRVLNWLERGIRYTLIAGLLPLGIALKGP